MRGQNLNRRRDYLPIDGEIEEADREAIEEAVFSIQHPALSESVPPSLKSDPESEVASSAEESKEEQARAERAAIIAKMNRTSAPDQVPWFRRSAFPSSSFLRPDPKFKLHPKSQSLIFPELDKEKETKENYQIKKVSAKFKSPGELVSQIVRVLKRYQHPLTINELLDKLLASQLVEPNYHIYNQVARALKNHYLLFKKTSKGAWALRKGCRKLQRPEELTIHPRLQPENALNLVEVIVNVVRESSVAFGTFPGLVHRQLQAMGYQCSLSSVRSAMKSSRFTKNGSWYHLADNPQQ